MTVRDPYEGKPFWWRVRFRFWVTYYRITGL